ncbi:hypothetical protein NE237_011166 [Protea cynaroides]|uniref:Uncharacterized protein n=1 Tax=Protea cynaroides TaxID=273540 RepID=A0A9Q0GXE8_9MAGN|nr:hypothetical protein NE237_011166 [Protea cynaroides]
MDGSTSHGSSTSHTTAELTHKRGRTRAERTRKRPSTVDIPTINLNSLGQVIGPHYTEFITFLGTIARTPTIVPLNYDDWRSVPMYYKEEAWKEIEEKLEQKLDEQPPDLRNDKSVQDDVFLQIMGPERNGCVLGAGKAIAPSNVGLAQSNVQKKKEDEELQATISNMQGEINDLKEQLTEMDQIKIQLMEMDQMKAQLKEMDQLKAQLTQMDQMKAQIAFLTQAFTGRNTSQSQFIYNPFLLIHLENLILHV